MHRLSRILRFGRRAGKRGDPINDLIVSHRFRFLYCPIPKAGNSSFKAWIRKIEGHDQYTRHLHDRKRSGLVRLGDVAESERKGMLSNDDWFRFIVVRDPFARVYSAWFDKFVPRADGNVAMPALAGKLRLLHQARFGRQGTHEPDHLSFRMFVQLVGDEKPDDMDPHWRPQVLLGAFDRVHYHLVGHLADVAAVAPEIARRVGAPEPMVFHRHRRTPAGTRLDRIYDEELAAIVRRVYSADFATFGFATAIPTHEDNG
jgi:Sulfotransferase family